MHQIRPQDFSDARKKYNFYQWWDGSVSLIRWGVREKRISFRGMSLLAIAQESKLPEYKLLVRKNTVN